MKKIILASTLLLSALLAKAQQPSADDILRTARYVATLQDTDLKGVIRKDSAKIQAPIALFLREEGIEFQVYDGKAWNKFQLKLADDEYDLFEGVGDKVRRFDRAKIKQSVMGTDLSYEDLAMSFLYWHDATVIGEESLGFKRDAWKVRLVNPKAVGRYKTVEVWVHKDSGALMKINGYEANGQCVKVFEVTKLMNVGGGEYSIKRMKVQSYGKDQRATGITYLEFEKPASKAPQGLR